MNANVIKVEPEFWTKKYTTKLFVSNHSEKYRNVYRLEDLNGDGPFRNDSKCIELTGTPFKNLKWLESIITRKRKLAIYNLGPDDCFDIDVLNEFKFFENWKTSKNGMKYYTNDFIYGFDNLSQIKFWFSSREIKIEK